ncbi:MAG TPA: phosphocholine cytidylyltransferase family protein [Alphaproteobacteria bacterium]
MILAAGRGRRLGSFGDDRPKILLRFGGRTLLQRHIEILEYCGIAHISVVVGYRADAVCDEIKRLGRAGRVSLIENPRYAEGSVVSLWSARGALASGVPALLMDGDVLYDWRLMQRLTRTKRSNCLLMDRNIEPGDEPVKLCIARDRIVDFHKKPRNAYEFHGESVGFFRLSPNIAAALLAGAADYVANGRHDQEYEEPLRDLILASAPGIFGYEDITGLPWSEIDFPLDVARARSAIVPRLSEMTAGLAAGERDAAAAR